MSPLTPDEIRFFKCEGYLIKRGVLDPELMARARERKWEGAPARMKRDDPGTWFGPFRPDEELVEERDNYRHDFTWKYMAPAREPWIVAMLVANPVLVGWAGQLLGRGEIEVPERIRGIYCQLPEGDLPPRPTVCHCDVTPNRLHSTPLAELLAPGLGAVGLIADIPPAGGAFAVWPGTHRIIHDLLLHTEGPARNEAYQRRIIEFNADPRVVRTRRRRRHPALAPPAGAYRGLEPVAADPSSAKPCCATTTSGRTRFPIPMAPSPATVLKPTAGEAVPTDPVGHDRARSEHPCRSVIVHVPRWRMSARSPWPPPQAPRSG